MSSMSNNNSFTSVISILVTYLLIAFLPGYARAHGEEDHSHEKQIPISSVINSVTRFSGQGTVFEVVAVVGTLAPKQDVTLDLYLANVKTNEPITSALISASISGQPGKVNGETHQFNAVGDSGIYHLTLLFPDTGLFDLMFDISTDKEAEFVEIQGLKVGLAGSIDFGDAGQRARNWITPVLLAVIGGLVLFVLVLLFRLRRLLSSREGIASLIFLSVFSIASSALAHGGEEHSHAGETNTSISPVGPGYMSKGSQFLLGVRTSVVRTEAVAKSIEARGTVIARPNSMAVIYPPQAGTLRPPSNGAIPQKGDYVTKGQILAEIQVLDALPIRAPISGTVLESFAVEGDNVDPSRPFLSIQNIDRVWIEGHLFPADYDLLTARATATVRVNTTPAETIVARFVSRGTSVDSVTLSPSVSFEVDNSRRLLRIGMPVELQIPVGSPMDMLTIPTSSVMNWDGQRVVFVKLLPEIFERRTVRIISTNGDRTSVGGDLRVGDRVVTSGAYQLLSMPHRVGGGGSQ